MSKVELTFEVDAELVAQARANGHEPLDLLLHGLRTAAGPTPGIVTEAATLDESECGAKAWREVNKDAIEERNRLIAERGLFADTARRW